MYIQRKNKKNYGFCLSISSRYVLARFSIGSRSSFVLPSFSLRCFFVRQSKINRRTNEETTKVKGKNFLGEDKEKRRWKRELSKMESLHQWATFCDNEGHIIFCFDILISLSFALRGMERDSQYVAKKRGLTLSAEDMGFYRNIHFNGHPMKATSVVIPFPYMPIPCRLIPNIGLFILSLSILS